MSTEIIIGNGVSYAPIETKPNKTVQSSSKSQGTSNADIVLTPMQEECVNKIKNWYLSQTQSFVLAGYAGTGKTFLVNYIIKDLGIDLEEVEFSTFTGKASLVLTQKANGEYTCHTLHKLLYDSHINEQTGEVSFTKKPRYEFSGIRLVVVDECSMVTQEILADLMDTRCKILFIGDNGQLPPVGNVSDIYNRLANSPDFMLTEIHRQAEGNPIIHLSMLAREGKPIPLGNHGNDVLVIRKNELGKYQKSLANADIVICGRNNTRQSLNHDIRGQKGYTSALPQKGDKLICVRNNWKNMLDDYALVNGMIGFVENIKVTSEFEGELKFRPDFVTSKHSVFESDIMTSTFKGSQPPVGVKSWFYDAYEFGYAVTCHKSQGSQWDRVFVVDEVLDPNTHNRWLYTAITRACKQLILAI